MAGVIVAAGVMAAACEDPPAPSPIRACTLRTTLPDGADPAAAATALYNQIVNSGQARRDVLVYANSLHTCGCSGDPMIDGGAGGSSIGGGAGGSGIAGGAGGSGIAGGAGGSGIAGGAGGSGLAGGAGGSGIAGGAGDSGIAGGAGSSGLAGGAGDSGIAGGAGGSGLAGGAGGSGIAGGAGGSGIGGGARPLTCRQMRGEYRVRASINARVQVFDGTGFYEATVEGL